MTLDDTIRAVQAHLGVAVDGRPGPQTWAAIHAALLGPGARAPVRRRKASASAPVPVPRAAVPAPLATPDTVDRRSEAAIATLLPEVRPYARALVQQAAGIGIRIRVVSALRTRAEQDALYARGRTTPGPRVTNVRGGHSNHNFGIAFDIGVFEGAAYVPASPKYKAVGALGIGLGLEWGGSWTHLVDEPHFQLRPAWARGLGERALLAGLRERLAAGTPAYA